MFSSSNSHHTGYYDPSEILINVTKQHEEYFNQEEDDKKLESLRLMRGYIRHYLYMVAQNKKFQFQSTDSVLIQSINCFNNEFEPREASEAFEILAKYAHNLIEEPWREEYYTIHMTAGFYIHNVSAFLQNAHEIFIEMNYVNISDEVLKLFKPPVCDLDFQILKSISRDCFMASQECLILSQIYEKVQLEEPDHLPPMIEVYNYRRLYMGDVEAISTRILYSIREAKAKAKEKSRRSLQLQRENYYLMSNSNGNGISATNSNNINRVVGTRHSIGHNNNNNLANNSTFSPINSYINNNSQQSEKVRHINIPIVHTKVKEDEFSDEESSEPQEESSEHSEDVTRRYRLNMKKYELLKREEKLNENYNNNNNKRSEITIDGSFPYVLQTLQSPTSSSSSMSKTKSKSKKTETIGDGFFTVQSPTSPISSSLKKSDSIDGNIGNFPRTHLPTPTPSPTAAVAASSASFSMEKIEKDENDFHLAEFQEWSCKHCTFINNGPTKICAVCCKTDYSYE